MNSDLLEDYQRLGYSVIPECVDRSTVAKLLRLTDSARMREDASESVSNKSGVYALRNLVDVVPEIAGLLLGIRVSELVALIVGSDGFMVRSTLFDKTDGANRGVFWHQDLSIAVRERHDIAAFHAWTRKAGVQCVQPPVEVMSQILSMRIHLDDCYAANGALRVLPGSHKSHVLSMASIEEFSASIGEVVCEVPTGGVVLMNPLLLRASSPMSISGHRRVIHLDFTSQELPFPLE